MDEITKNIFYNRLYMYPSDFCYLKELAKNLRMKESELWRLTSVMGAQELANTLPLVNYKNFCFDDKSPFDFRFNLHTHSKYSDGAMNIDEWLNNAAILANERANIRDDLPPFTVALTDHDCIDGNLEVLKLLIKNPDKYKNLRVVLGCELGAVWMNSNVQRVPLEFELIWFGLNPFDKNITDFLLLHHKKRVAATKGIINKLNLRFPDADFSYEEACKKQPLLYKNQGLGFYNRVYTYAVDKLANEVLNGEVYSICRMYNDTFGGNDKYPGQKIDDIFNLVRCNHFGFLGIAHPQKLNASKFINDEFANKCNQEGKNAAFELVMIWLDMLRRKGLKAMDINYQFDNGELLRAQQMLEKKITIDNNFAAYHWIKLFAEYAEKYAILCSGGYDSHNKDFRTR